MPPQFQVVKSTDIYHGLPTYPEKPEYQGLTAIVTGANGKSVLLQMTYSTARHLLPQT
jgi:hypothetical protein